MTADERELTEALFKPDGSVDPLLLALAVVNLRAEQRETKVEARRLGLIAVGISALTNPVALKIYAALSPLAAAASELRKAVHP